MWEGPGLWEGPECERALNVGGPCQETEEDLWNDNMTGYLVWPGEDCRLHSVIGSYSAGNSCLK
jgi:hypothetical protein